MNQGICNKNPSLSNVFDFEFNESNDWSSVAHSCVVCVRIIVNQGICNKNPSLSNVFDFEFNEL